MTEIETEQDEPVTEAQRGAPAGDEDDRAGRVAEEPPVAPGGPRGAERERLIAQRADLVERRRLIVSGQARDDYGRMIERIDRRLAVRREVAG